MFLEKNKQINLSAIRDADGVFLKHIKDSIELGNVIKLKKGYKVCDIGTGGGFPLLPLAMTNKDTQFVGIDARRKKVDAVNDMIKDLGLKNVVCKRSRIEDVDEKFDILTARAVGYVDKIIKWSYNLLEKTGLWILYKQYSENEYEDMKEICKKYNISIEKEHRYKLYKDDIERIIYILKKV
ncbi:MAG TPA: 16S rRNA (guanine(527)-N(7))-methyltransferase RsmG [Candidatus Absconditabacterales bacterium]|nr:16S rRNA (guanine(527)-N(7))-methyltransferase RsmG [Candidatus Absconditabacterales bacterium]